MQTGMDAEGFLVLCGASRSKTINYEGSLRDYLAALGLQRLQVRDRDSAPEDVVRTLSKRRKRYTSQGHSVELSLVAQPASQKTVMTYDIVRKQKRRSVEVGQQVIGSATLIVPQSKFTVETSDHVVPSLPDAPVIDEFCRELYQDFVDAPRRINPSSAAWMGRKVLEHLGGVVLIVRDRSSTTWWMPASGVEKAREYFDGLCWDFLAIPVQMTEALAEAIEASRERTKGAA